MSSANAWNCTDIQFWRQKKTFEGLSVRTIMLNVVSQFIVFLYLLDNETSWMVLLSVGMGLLIEVWKLRKAVNFRVCAMCILVRAFRIHLVAMNGICSTLTGAAVLSSLCCWCLRRGGQVEWRGDPHAALEKRARRISRAPSNTISRLCATCPTSLPLVPPFNQLLQQK